MTAKHHRVPPRPRLANGTPVAITAAEPDDLADVRRFYEALSDTSMYYRFFGFRPAMPDGELRAMVAHDLARHVTLLAWLDHELVGIGEYVGPGEGEAELAFAVADAHHHEGVATLLLERLAHIAKRRGLRRLVAHTMGGNAAMREVFRTAGLAHESRLDGAVIDYTFDLSSLAGLDAGAATRRAMAEGCADVQAVRP